MSKSTLKPIISKLREIIIKEIAGKLEKYGFDESGKIAVNKPLSNYDKIVKNNVLYVFRSRKIEGDKSSFIRYIQDTARTFLHILICFKAIENRGLIGKVLDGLLDNRNYDFVIPDFKKIHPLAFSDLSDKYKDEISKKEKDDNFEDDTDYYRFIVILEKLSKEMAKEIPVLFRDYEHTLVHPDFEGIKEILFNLSKIEDSEFFEDDFFGWIYQYWVDVKDDELKVAENNGDISYGNKIYYEVLKNLQEKQTRFGEFYTPRWVVKYIVDNTLNPYFEENQDVETIKLLDPACGSGNFLVYAFDVFYELYKTSHPDWTDSSIIKSIFEKNIYGVDIQLEPLQITGINLWLKAKKKAAGIKVEILNLFNTNILRADSLRRWEDEAEESMQLSIFNTDLELTEKQYTEEDIGKYFSEQDFRERRDAKVFFRNKFNIIVMNPPFVDARKMDQQTSEFLKKQYPDNSRNLFSAFIQRASELSTEKGYIGFITSNTFMTLGSFEKLRKMLVEKLTILKLIDLGRGVFEEVAVDSSITLLKNMIPQENVALGANIRKALKEVKNCNNNINEAINSSKHYYIDQEIFKRILGFPLIFDITNNIRNAFLANFSFGSGEKSIVEIKAGMQTGDNDRFLRFKWEIPGRLLNKEYFPYAKGGGFSKYANDMYDYILWSEDGNNVKSFKGSVIRNEVFYFKEAITYSDITSENRFSARYLPKGSIFDTTGSCIFPKSKNIIYLLGFINSKIVNYYLCTLNPTPHFQVGDLQRIPFIEPSKEDEDLVIEKTLKAKEIKEHLLGFFYTSDFYQRVELAYGFSQGAKTVDEAYKIFINKYNTLETELYNLQIEIDQIIYKIYELEADDIAIIEEAFPNIPPKPNKNNELKKVTLNFIRAITKNILIESPAKLYEDTEIETLIKQHIEKSFENGYKITEEIEGILEKPIIDVIRCGVKIGSKSLTLAGTGSKDLDEPLLQQKVLTGTGNNKIVVIWHLTHFLLEFEENKRYAMQNEIRRIKELYIKRLESVKDKILAGNRKSEIEKQDKLLSESIKTLEIWKVV